MEIKTNKFYGYKGKSSAVHPIYVYEQNGKEFKGLLVTHVPQHIKLSKNIDNYDSTDCYIKTICVNDNCNALEENEKFNRYYFGYKDKLLIDEIIKVNNQIDSEGITNKNNMFRKFFK